MVVLTGVIGLFALACGTGYFLLSRHLGPGVSPPERWSLYLGTGFWAIAFVSSMTWLIPLHRFGMYHPTVIPIVSGVVISALAWLRVRGAGTRAHPEPRGRPAGSDWLVLLGTAVTFLLFFVGVSDDHFTAGCLYRSLEALSITGPHPDLPVFRLTGDERFGNVVAAWTISGFSPIAFERLGHGFFAALLFLSAAALGRRLTGRNWPGLLAASAMILTDDVFGYEVMNQNMIGAGAAMLMVLVTFQDRHGARGALLTFLWAMLVSSRHVAAAGLGAWADALGRESPEAPLGTRLRRLAGHGLLFLVFSVPTLVAVATGQTGLDRTLAQRFFNYPVHEEVVRSPLLPFPMLIGWPLDLLVQWGIVGVSLALVGWVCLWLDRRGSGHARPLLLFGLPIFVVLLLQENWIEPEKMSIDLLLAPIFVTGIAVALGKVGPLGRTGARAALLAVCLVLGAGFLGVREVLRTTAFPEDPRVRMAYPGLPGETNDILDFERERWLRWTYFPLVRSDGVLRAFEVKLRDVERLIRHGKDPRARPSVSEQAVAFLDETIENRTLVERAMAPASGMRVVETRSLCLRLHHWPFLTRTPFLVETPAPQGSPVLDLGDGRECAMSAVRGMRVPYTDRPIRILVCTRGDEVFVSLAPPKVPTLDWDETAPAGTPPHWILETPPRIEDLPVVTEVELRIPKETHRVTFLSHLYLDPTRIYATTVSLGRDGPGEPAPPFIWHAN